MTAIFVRQLATLDFVFDTIFNNEGAASPVTEMLPTIIFFVAYKPLRRCGFLGA
jgi:hypothetical protein